jgi:hypothetical protein
VKGPRAGATLERHVTAPPWAAAKLEAVARSVPFKKLASELIAHGVESQYLARVEARVTREEQLENVQLEIAQEIANALGRSEDRVNLALAELDLCRARYERARAAGAPEAEVLPLIERYNAQRTVAQARLRDLLIHREAVGFRRNQILNELYPIPPRLERS